MGSRQIVLVSTAGFSVLNTEIFWREAKTKVLAKVTIFFLLAKVFAKFFSQSVAILQYIFRLDQDFTNFLYSAIFFRQIMVLLLFPTKIVELFRAYTVGGQCVYSVYKSQVTPSLSSPHLDAICMAYAICTLCGIKPSVDNIRVLSNG